MKKNFELVKDVTTDELPGLLTTRCNDGWDFVAVVPTGRIARPTWDVIFSKPVELN